MKTQIFIKYFLLFFIQKLCDGDKDVKSAKEKYENIILQDSAIAFKLPDSKILFLYTYILLLTKH